MNTRSSWWSMSVQLKKEFLVFLQIISLRKVSSGWYAVTSHLIWRYLNDFPICLVMTTSISQVAYSALHAACYISLEDVTHITATRIVQHHLRRQREDMVINVYILIHSETYRNCFGHAWSDAFPQGHEFGDCQTGRHLHLLTFTSICCDFVFIM